MTLIAFELEFLLIYWNVSFLIRKLLQLFLSLPTCIWSLLWILSRLPTYITWCSITSKKEVAIKNVKWKRKGNKVLIDYLLFPYTYINSTISNFKNIFRNRFWISVVDLCYHFHHYKVLSFCFIAICTWNIFCESYEVYNDV